MYKPLIAMPVMREEQRSCGSSEGRRSLPSGHIGSLWKAMNLWQWWKGCGRQSKCQEQNGDDGVT